MDILATGGFIGNKAIVCGGYKYLATGFDVYMDDCYSITQNKIEFLTKITGYIRLSSTLTPLQGSFSFEN